MYKYICECNIEHSNFSDWHFGCKCKYCLVYWNDDKLNIRYKIGNLSFFIHCLEQYIVVQDPNKFWNKVLEIPFIELSSNEEYIRYFEKCMDNLIFL